MSLWRVTPTLEQLQTASRDSMVEHLGIRFTAIGADTLSASMPVDTRTHQPYGLLHGGASVALAESLGSMAATLTLDPATHYCVGIEINANHVRAVREGVVTGTASPLHIGRTTQVWQIEIHDEDNRLVCVSRITLAVLEQQR